MTEDSENLADNQYKRPLYERGMRVRVTRAGIHHDWRGTILSVKAYQTIAGIVMTYFYDVEMDNLAHLGFVEEDIAPEE